MATPGKFTQEDIEAAVYDGIAKAFTGYKQRALQMLGSNMNAQLSEQDFGNFLHAAICKELMSRMGGK